MCVEYVVEDFYKKAHKEYNRLRKSIEEKSSKRAMQAYYEYVRDNKELFDREYYIKQLKLKGFTFE